MVFENMLTMQGMMFFFVIVGFIVRKKEIVGTTGRLNMVDLCLYVLLPFNIFHAFLVQPHHDVWKPVVITVLLSILYNAVSVASSFLLYRRTDEERRKPLRYGTIVSNGGFLGNPVIESIYGTSGLLYASVFMLPVRVVMWSVGVSCFLPGQKKNVIKKVITHPCIVAIYLGLIVMMLPVSWPDFFTRAVDGLSSANTPVSMMLIGMMLAEMDPRGLIDRTMVFYAAVRLVLIPAIIFVLTAPFPVDPVLRGIAVIMAGMPAPVTTALLSSKYHGDERYATGMIFLSTLLSLLTLPLWCLVIG